MADISKIKQDGGDEKFCDDQFYALDDTAHEQQQQQQTQQQHQQQNCHRTNSSNLAQDEILITEIREFPCLYDRSDSDYKRNNTSQDAWTKIREKCTWIESNDEAARLFEVLKKRYSKKKMDFKRAHMTARESLLTKKTQLELEKYDFMRWMEPFIRFRTTKLVSEKTQMTEGKTYENRRENYLPKHVGEYTFEPTMRNRKRSYDTSALAYNYNDNRPAKQNVYFEDPTNLVYSKQISPTYQREVPALSLERRNSIKHDEAKRKPPALEDCQVLVTPAHGGFARNQNNSQQQQQHHRLLNNQYGDCPINGTHSPTSTEGSHKSTNENEDSSVNNNNIVSKTVSHTNHGNTKIIYETRVLKDEDELFAALIVSEMKNLNERMKYKIKHRISNVLFDALSGQFSTEKQQNIDSECEKIGSS